METKLQIFQKQLHQYCKFSFNIYAYVSVYKHTFSLKAFLLVNCQVSNLSSKFWFNLIFAIF